MRFKETSNNETNISENKETESSEKFTGPKRENLLELINKEKADTESNESDDADDADDVDDNNDFGKKITEIKKEKLLDLINKKENDLEIKGNGENIENPKDMYPPEDIRTKNGEYEKMAEDNPHLKLKDIPSNATRDEAEKIISENGKSIEKHKEKLSEVIKDYNKEFTEKKEELDKKYNIDTQMEEIPSDANEKEVFEICTKNKLLIKGIEKQYNPQSQETEEKTNETKNKDDEDERY